MSALKEFLQGKDFKILDQPNPYGNTVQIAEDANGKPVFLDIDIAGSGADQSTPNATWFELSNGADLENDLTSVIDNKKEDAYKKAVDKLFKDTGINPIGPFQVRITIKE
jgi:hypothetical protein